jgi:GGDEF domain-containing protein
MPPSRVLTIDEPEVSRGAIQIERTGGRFVIWDTSENGIFVNGRFVHGGSVPIEAGDEILIGKTRMVILAERPETEVASLGTIEVDRAKLDQVALLFPRTDAASVVDLLLEQELGRRNQPDALTGVGSLFSLLRAVPRTPVGRQGYGSSSRRGLDGTVERWMIAADVLGLLRINDRVGMRAGDEVLMLLAAAFRDVARSAYCIRMHGDAFVAISDAPWNFEEVQSEIEIEFRKGIGTAACEPLRSLDVGLTFASLHLVVDRPHAPIVLGPLFCAEIERALLASRISGEPLGVQHRTIRLDGYVAE